MLPEIRAVQSCELTVLAALQAACFSASSSASRGQGADASAASYVGEPWSARSWAEVLAMPGSFALLAVIEEGPVGFFAGQVLFENSELLSLGVLPSHRRAGCGRRLIERGLGEAARRGAERMALEVAENNRGGRFLYQSCGFAVAGRRPGYYRGPDGKPIDALILSRSLASA